MLKREEKARQRTMSDKVVVFKIYLQTQNYVLKTVLSTTGIPER